MPRRTRITMPNVPLILQHSQYLALDRDADARQVAYRNCSSMSSTQGNQCHS